MMRKLFLVLSILLTQIGLMLAQGEPAPDYKLGPGDLVQVRVLNVEGYTHEVRLTNGGEILLPHLGMVKAGGKTTTALASDLSQLMNDTIFRDPTVSVTVSEYRSQPVVLLGAVKEPGTFQKVQSSYKLIDLLSEAGGVLETAGDIIKVQRRADGVDSEVIELAMSDLYGARLATLNYELQAGDVVTIPPRDERNPDVFFVIGEVGRPGDYAFPEKRDLNVAQAISAAGGPLKTAKADKGMLVRYNPDGSQSRIPFNFSKMLRGKESDLKIQPQDIVFIPGSTIKTIGLGLLGVIPQGVQQVTTTGITKP